MKNFIAATIFLFVTSVWGQVTVNNCGLILTPTEPPTRVITLNQGATEIMLALGLQDVMVGTAYLDDKILPEYEVSYAAIPVLAKEYPSKEVILASEPDFIYASYASAFDEGVAGTREQLIASSVTPYLSPFACEDKTLRAEASVEAVYQEIRDVAALFGVSERAETLIAEMQADLLQVQTITREQTPVRVFWYDSGQDEAYAGACCGAPALIMDYLNVENIFADTEGSWATVSWEAVLDRNPDVMILADASWDSADERIKFLQGNPRFSRLESIANERFITIPFSYTTPGIRNVAAVRHLAEQLYPQAFN